MTENTPVEPDLASTSEGIVTVALPYPAATAPAGVREAHPLVQCITNTVTQAFTANALLAIGASPAMVDTPEDAGAFAGIASCALINFGTPGYGHYAAAEAVIPVLSEAHRPWTLDPVGIGPMPHRAKRIAATARCKPTILRGNASEILALAGRGAGGRGVESTDRTADALDAAAALAAFTRGAVAVSGPFDAIVSVREDEVLVALVEGGHPLMAEVIGTGCALGAVCAAYAAVTSGPDAPLRAAAGAHLHFAAAGALAARREQRPGSYAVAFLDALHELSTGGSGQMQAELRFEKRALPSFTVSP